MENTIIEDAKKYVSDLMSGDNSGHGMEHVNRVVELAMKFAKEERCNEDIVFLSALLHDVDDYKLFGTKNQAELTNTNKILNDIGAKENIKNAVLDIVGKIGYTKRLKGLTPSSIEGKIVSDADMCDAIGANGILRTFQYSIKYGKPFFDKNVLPRNIVTAENQIKKVADTCVCHMFEKLLKLYGLMLTDAGKKEAKQRHEFMILFLRQLFGEESASNWQKYLDDFLKTY